MLVVLFKFLEFIIQVFSRLCTEFLGMKLRVGDLPNKRKMKIRTFDISKFHQQKGTKKNQSIKGTIM